ncbi:hypothetical protein PoB_004474900 [Plakobranchus ocellatus]|uniref:Uncharacterized protein n=1 Tax=Plakobranchus ocellatus TaxID=259542 RepID=A0AAV4BDN4_9GAST|nr:hypothetical protein PoB_004474900 [Plakobranchus ocellatus]
MSLSPSLSILYDVELGQWSVLKPHSSGVFKSSATVLLLSQLGISILSPHPPNVHAWSGRVVRSGAFGMIFPATFWAIPSDEQDNIGKLAREILGPYLHFLTSSASSSPSPSLRAVVSRHLPESEATSNGVSGGRAGTRPGDTAGSGKTGALLGKPAAVEDEGGGGSGQSKNSAAQRRINPTASRHPSSTSAVASDANGDEAASGGVDKGGGGKRPTSLMISQQNHSSSSSSSANRPSKPPLLPTPPGPSVPPLSSTSSQPSTSASQDTAHPPTSSPASSALSPANHKDIPTAFSRDGTGQANAARSGADVKLAKELTPPPPSHHSKSRKPTLSRSPMKDPSKSKPASLQSSSSLSSSLSSSSSSKDRQHQQPLSSPSKPHKSTSLPSGGNKEAAIKAPFLPSSSSTSSSSSTGRQNSPVVTTQISTSSSSSSLLSASSSSLTPAAPLATTSSSSSSGSHHRHSRPASPKLTTHMSSSAKDIPVVQSKKPSATTVSPPAGRPRSITPTKAGATRPLNGIVPSSKSIAALSSSSSSSTSSSSSSSSSSNTKDAKVGSAGSGSAVDSKTKSLKIIMPADTKKATSKVDLDSIFKEMEAVAPHTAIETPQKMADRFPFPSAAAAAAAVASEKRLQFPSSCCYTSAPLPEPALLSQVRALPLASWPDGGPESLRSPLLWTGYTEDKCSRPSSCPVV